MLSQRDKKIIPRLSQDIPDSRRPFYSLAKELGLSEEELLDKIIDWKKKGLIRRFGAVLNHRAAGYLANAMVVWQAARGQTKEAGRVMASFSRVSHCYERKTSPEWPYNLFTMVHARSREECEKVVEEISQKTGIRNYKLLFTLKEFKKAPVKYNLLSE